MCQKSEVCPCDVSSDDVTDGRGAFVVLVTESGVTSRIDREWKYVAPAWAEAIRIRNDRAAQGVGVSVDVVAA